MLEQFKYVNHLREVVEFGKGGIYANYNDLRDYQWSFSKVNSKISRFNKEIVSKKLPVIIQAPTEAEALTIKNRLFEVIEKDVLSGKYGMIVIGGYYYRCYITASKKSEYLISKRHLRVDLTVSSDCPVWVKETEVNFNTATASDGGLNFPHDYAFDFTNLMNAQNVNNTSFAGCNFRMVIYGACMNPTIIIGGNTYQVNCTVESGQYLTIDCAAKKVYLTKANGETVNQFNNRNKSYYIFEPIQPGINAVSWTGDLKFDVILLDERGEPKWN